MKGNQINIPLNSNVDVGTYDIIQEKDISFKRKNSIVYKGTLSNLTHTKGEGILSTDGKEIVITKDGIKAGDTLFSFNDEINVAANYESINSFRDVLFARRTDNDLLYIRKPSYNTLKVHTNAADFDIVANDTVTLVKDGAEYKANVYNINGFISQNEGTETGLIYPNLIMVVVSYYNDEIKRYYNKYSIYSLNGKCMHTWEDNFYGSGHESCSGSDVLALGEKMTGYVRHYQIDNIVYNYIYWGFDDEDMRKRFIMRSYYYFDVRSQGARVEDWDAGTEPEDSGYLFNETVEAGDKIPTFSSDGLIYSGREIVYFGEDKQVTWGIFPLVWGFGLISDRGYVYGEPLIEKTPKNQSIQPNRARGLWNTVYRTLENGVIVVEVPNDKRYWNGSTFVTEANSRSKMNSLLGNNPLSYSSGSQSGAANWTVVDFTNYVEDGSTAHGYDYNYILSIDLSIPEVWQTLSAIDNDSKLPNSVAHITFFNFSDTFGKMNENVGDAEQMFPHMRFFMNVQQERGKYWDYGKGWNCLALAQLYVNKYSSYGVALWETPLQLIYNTVETFDITHYNNSLDAIQATMTIVGNADDGWNVETELVKLNMTATTYPLNSGNAFVRESKFQAAFSNYLVGTKFQEWHQYLRLHPITENMRDKGLFVYSNHTWSGIADNSTLSVLTHTYNLDSNLNLGVYSSIPTCLSAFRTLLFTPQDIGDNFCFDITDKGYYVTKFGKDEIESVEIIHNATWEDVTVEKIADYEFRLNLLGTKNLLVEDHSGHFVLQRAFSPYIMDTVMENIFNISLPSDGTSVASNGVYYFGAGANFNLDGDVAESSTFLLPAFTIQTYVSTSDIDTFNHYTLDDRNGKLRADLWCFEEGATVQEFWTFNRATTDVLYKNSRYIDNAFIHGDKFEIDYSNTSWWAEDIIIYPVGIVSKVNGVDYTTPTIDAGNNYAARLYRNNNKTFLVFNQNDLVYFGDRIFTVQSGNYYYDGQAIYYLGSRDDYSQNIFTAYAIGMKFLANSSSEAYFYSVWDKSLYLFTSSNTLQKADSLADMGNIVDSLYSSLEQTLYILFDDNKLLCKTQDDSMLIENVVGNKLQSTAFGCEILNNGKSYEIYNPYYWNDIEELDVETEWLGSSDKLIECSYADIVLLDETESSTPTVNAFITTIDGTEVKRVVKQFDIKKSDWQNHLARIRIVPNSPKGNAVKIGFSSKDLIKVMNLSVRVVPVSDTPQGPNDLRG